MHPNPIFRQETQTRNIEFIRDRSFGTLAVNADDGPLLSHIPFTLSEDCKSLEFHLVRSNPILRVAIKPLPAVISVTRGDAYISPDWYGVEDQVPTWNYIAVHIRGTITKLPAEEMHGVLERLSNTMEKQLLPKKPWTSEKMDQDVYNRMLRQIVPFRIDISKIEGTWKLSQNKPVSVRQAASEGVAKFPIGSETELISKLMHEVGDAS